MSERGKMVLVFVTNNLWQSKDSVTDPTIDRFYFGLESSYP